MIEDFNFSGFANYLQEINNSDDSLEGVNGFETLVEYLSLFPPEGLEESDRDSDFYREEIDRLAQELIYQVEDFIKNNESSWVTIHDGKWFFSSVQAQHFDETKSELFRKLDSDEAALLKITSRKLDALKRRRLVHLYKEKIEKYGTDDEKYDAATLIADSYQYNVSQDGDYVKNMLIVGNLSRALKKKDSYKYFENVAKFHRSNYDHDESAKCFQYSIDTAQECDESDEIILSLTKKMRIQYESCSDEDNASIAFISENKLKVKLDKRLRVKIALALMGLLSDFCQNPKKVALWALGLIVLSTIVYSTLGIAPSGSNNQHTILDNSGHWELVLWDAFYFSVVTFSTLGYGDFSPNNTFTRLMAIIEALGGLFFTSLFLATLVRKYGR